MNYLKAKVEAVQLGCEPVIPCKIFHSSISRFLNNADYDRNAWYFLQVSASHYSQEMLQYPQDALIMSFVPKYNSQL